MCQEWHIKDWRNNQQIFKRLARCPVEIDFGDNSKEKTIMTFFLKDDTSAPSQGLHLCVSVNHGKAPMAFVVNTVTLDGNGVGMDIGGGGNVSSFSSGYLSYKQQKNYRLVMTTRMNR